MMLNSPTYLGSRAEEDPQAFIDEIEKIFRVMHASDSKRVNFVSYPLKEVAYQWYEKWEEL